MHHFFYATGEQPIGFTSSDEPTVGYRYVYDGLGRRVAKDTINTTTGEVIHRDVFTHTGSQLAAVTTTIDTTDSARVGEGYVWTTDPATGETHGQIALTSGTGDANDTPANPAAGWSQARVDATFYALVCDLAGAPQELINTTTGVVEGHTTQTLYGKRIGPVGAPARCCLPVSTMMLNPGGRTTASATTTPPWVPTTPKTHSDSPHDSPQHRGMSTTQHSG